MPRFVLASPCVLDLGLVLVSLFYGLHVGWSAIAFWYFFMNKNPDLKVPTNYAEIKDKGLVFDMQRVEGMREEIWMFDGLLSTCLKGNCSFRRTRRFHPFPLSKPTGPSAQAQQNWEAEEGVALTAKPLFGERRKYP